MSVFRLIQIPHCKVLMVDEWNAPPRRYFIGFRLRGTFRHVMGLPVISEFATFSSPIFFAPAPLLGKVYNAGISLAHQRDAEMAIDTGWPPLCIGTEDKVPSPLPDNWEQTILDALRAGESSLSLRGAGRFEIYSNQIDDYTIQFVQFSPVTVFATDAPLSPKQLGRLAQLGTGPFTIAFSTGNTITRPPKGTPLSIKVISEGYFNRIVEGFLNRQ